MKKISVLVVSVLTMALASCGTQGLGTAGQILGALAGNGTAASGVANAASSGANLVGGLLQTATSGNNLGNLLASVIGLDKVTAANLVGTWKYSRPGCAFTSEQLLAKAGGEMIAANVKEKLQTAYSKVGVKPENTALAFSQDGTFTGLICGKQISGTYVFNEATQAIELKTLLFSLNGFVKQNSDGIAILFESKKIMTLIQTIGAVSGNSTLNSISNVASNYDGVRVGFDLVR